MTKCAISLNKFILMQNIKLLKYAILYISYFIKKYNNILLFNRIKFYLLKRI